ncbi:MAG: bacterial Ig-like domain-containing protein [Clostridia bacterium]|nr:bacterial Ig-like domain-containing protein [Clostridia bacterium]
MARTVEKTMAGLSKKGTYTYMAPEIYKGEDGGLNSDLYSLGITMYKLLNDNREPFLPPSPARVNYTMKQQALVRRMGGEMIPRVEGISDALWEIVKKACAFSAGERYQEAGEMKADLQAFLASHKAGGCVPLVPAKQEQPVTAVGVNDQTVAVASSRPITTDAKPIVAERPDQGKKKRRVAVWMIVVVALFIVVLLCSPPIWRALQPPSDTENSKNVWVSENGEEETEPARTTTATAETSPTSFAPTMPTTNFVTTTTTASTSQEITAVSLSVSTPMRYTVGATFDYDNTTVVLFYSDGSRKTLNTRHCALSGFDTSSPGERTVTLHYGGLKATFQIDVVNPTTQTPTTQPPTPDR